MLIIHIIKIQISKISENVMTQSLKNNDSEKQFHCFPKIQNCIDKIN